MKTITKEGLHKMSPCADGFKWYVKHCGEKRHSVLTVIEALIKSHPENKEGLRWANWFIVRVMTRKQYLRYAIYAAEQVISIYEIEYPEDDRPRKAIGAAKAVLKKDNAKTRAAAYADAAAAAYAAADAAAYAAANAAAYAAYAAYAANAANAANDAANAAYAANDAAYAAYAADAAYAAAAENKRDEMLKKILNYGISLLDK